MTDDANSTLSAYASTPIYQGITLDIVANNARSGERISIMLRGRDGTNVAWSTGLDFNRSSGIRLNAANQSAVPISSLRVDGETITLVIAPDATGAGSRFAVQIFLVADPKISQFTLALMTDANSTVYATLPMRQPQPLGGSPTIFDWNEF